MLDSEALALIGAGNPLMAERLSRCVVRPSESGNPVPAESGLAP